MEKPRTSRPLVKATLMYKTVLTINLSPSNSPLQNSTIVAPTIILGILKMHLALPRPKINFLKRSFKYSGAMRWNNLSYQAKQHDSIPNLKANMPLCLLLDRSDSVICV